MASFAAADVFPNWKRQTWTVDYLERVELFIYFQMSYYAWNWSKSGWQWWVANLFQCSAQFKLTNYHLNLLFCQVWHYVPLLIKEAQNAH